MIDPSPEHTADGQGVALQQGDREQRRDSIKGDRTSDVYERQSNADTAREPACIDGKFSFWINGAQPLRKGQTFVSCKGEQIAHDSGEVCDVGRHVEKADDCQHDDSPGNRHRITEHVDGRIRCRVVQSSLQVRYVITDRYYRREIEHEVDNIDDDHGLRDSEIGVSDFFGHV